METTAPEIFRRPPWITPVEWRFMLVRSALLRPFVFRPEQPGALGWWTVSGILSASVAIFLGSHGGAVPKHVIAELRFGPLRRALLRRQNRLDRIAINRSKVYVIEAQDEGSWAAWSEPVRPEGKRYHWDEYTRVACNPAQAQQIVNALPAGTCEVMIRTARWRAQGVLLDPFRDDVELVDNSDVKALEAALATRFPRAKISSF